MLITYGFCRYNTKGSKNSKKSLLHRNGGRNNEYSDKFFHPSKNTVMSINEFSINSVSHSDFSKGMYGFGLINHRHD